MELRNYVTPDGRDVFDEYWGPGYRIYFGKDGKELIILLGGGPKARQDSDIKAARSRWKAYKDRQKARE